MNLPDPSILLQGRGITVPDAMQTAGQGLSLAHIMMQVQAQGDAVQKQRQMADLYSDPAYMAALLGPQGAAPGGGGGAPGPQMGAGGPMPPGAPGAPGMPGAAAGGAPDGGAAPPRTTFADALRRNPLAAPAGIKSLTDASKDWAELRAKDAETAKAMSAVITQRIQTTANMAAELARNPTQQGYAAMLAQMKFSGLPADAFGSPPSVMEGPNAIKAYATTIASAGTSPKDAAEIAKVFALLPGEVAQQGATLGKTKADTAQAEATTAWMPFENQTKRISANASATSAAASTKNADTQRMQYDAPNLQHLGDAASGFASFDPKRPELGGTGFTAAPAMPMQKQVQGNAKALDLINQAEKLLPDATHSLVGRGVDATLGVLGKSTKGANAIAALEPIAAALIMANPRLEGPQSDADRKLYAQGAGDLANPNVPLARKIAAIQSMKKIIVDNNARLGIGPAAAAPGGGGGATTRVDELPRPSAANKGHEAVGDAGDVWVSDGKDWKRVR